MVKNTYLVRRLIFPDCPGKEVVPAWRDHYNTVRRQRRGACMTLPAVFLAAIFLLPSHPVDRPGGHVRLLGYHPGPHLLRAGLVFHLRPVRLHRLLPFGGPGDLLSAGLPENFAAGERWRIIDHLGLLIWFPSWAWEPSDLQSFTFHAKAQLRPIMAFPSATWEREQIW